MYSDLPSVSIIIVAKNSEKLLTNNLQRIKEQCYPKDKIEVLIIDGGSTDNTENIVDSFNYKFINGNYPDNAEARRFVGLQHASNDIVVSLDTDNLINYNKWLYDMVVPFIENEDLVASFTKWYAVDSTMGSLDQYYGLVGGNDTVPYYLGKNDRVPYLSNNLPLGATLLADRGSYELVEFNSKLLPTVGCNGFLARRKILEEINCQDANEWLHIDVNVDIIEKLGYNKYAIVKNSILHLTGENIFTSIRKRLRYMNTHHVDLKQLRRYKVFDFKSKKDLFKLFLMIIFTMTLIEPLYRSLVGYSKTKNLNWFYHPILSFFMTLSYSYSFLKGLIK
jgi:glycosyltransferase involved in cell wall biosynthesis